VPHGVFDVRFGDVKRYDGNFAVAFAQCSNLGVSRDPVLNAVDGVDGRSHRTVKSTAKMV
jgi:hypothetical protein